VTSAVIGIAIDEGQIGSVDDPIVAYLLELRGKVLERVTIRHLLMSSGINYVSDDDISGPAQLSPFRVLGVPVVLPLPGGAGDLASSFPGLSTIVDSDGAVKAALGEEEGVVVASVVLDPARKATAPPPRFRRTWGVWVPWYAFIWPLTQRQGERAYAHSAKRKARAMALSHAGLTALRRFAEEAEGAVYVGAHSWSVP
jgi:hypothetical protein